MSVRPASVLTGLCLLAACAAPVAAQTWSTANTLQPARPFSSATAAGGKAFFAGGGHPFVGYDATVNIHDSTLGPPTDPASWSTASLSVARSDVAATSVGGTVLFAGGAGLGFGQPVSAVVDVYDLATDTWSTDLLSEGRLADAVTSVAGYALFAGGNPNNLGDPGPPSARIDIYEAATDSWSQASLAVPRMDVQATTVGPYALFAGGSLFTFGDVSDVVEVYDSTVGPPTDPGAWSIAHLSQARLLAAATSAGGMAFFAGGLAEVSPGVFEAVTTVDVYDSCLGPPSDPAAWSVEHLSAPRVEGSATSQGDEALFGGGVESTPFGSIDLAVVDVFDTRTGTWSVETLSAARVPAATTVGDHALFGGGQDDVNWVFGPYDLVDIRQATSGHWYVDAAAVGAGDGSPGAPFATIQAGLDAAQAGDTVHVGPGTYGESLSVVRDVSLVGTCGRDVTTIFTGTSGTSLITSTNATLHLEGFTLASGRAPLGGGLHVAGGAVTVQDCSFSANKAGGMSTGHGGGIYVASGTLEVFGTSFTNNATGGGYGSAIYGSPLVRDCEFFDNRIENQPPPYPLAGGTAIYGNPRIENSVFARNTSSQNYPSLMAADPGTPLHIVNSTFVNNGSFTHNRYVLADGSTVRNSIFWNVTANVNLTSPDASTLDVQNSLVPGGFPGVGNLGVNPMLLDSYRPRPGSPVIDAGDNGAVPAALLTDLAGKPRFLDDPATSDTGVGAAPIVDMGAYEFRPRARFETEHGQRGPAPTPGTPIVQ